MSMRWVLLLGCLSCGCATSRNSTPAISLYPVERASAVTFCADGSGGPGGTTNIIRFVANETKAPLRVEMVDWSHGKGRYMADHLDWRNIEDAGLRLAKQTCEFRRAYPDKRVTFVGQSAGAAVVLVAAAAMPADSVDRVILLAPSVSTRSDLRPALRSCREGIDVYYSRNDWFVLGLGMALSGTTDRDLAPAAGRVGFRTYATEPGDADLYRRLRQHEWDSSVSWTGNTGGHFGPSSQGHVQHVLMPMLVGETRGRR